MSDAAAGPQDVQALHRRRVPALGVRPHATRREGHNVARASRKDARDAVVAARKARSRRGRGNRLQPRPGALPARRDDGDARGRARRRRASGRRRSSGRSTASSGTRAGPTSSPQVLGSSNPVAGPYFNFTRARADRRRRRARARRAGARRARRRGSSPALVGGNAVVVVASETHPLAAIELAEAIATSDVPGGVVNVLTGSAPSSRRCSRRTWTSTRSTSPAPTATPRARGARRRQRQARRARRREEQSPWEIAAFLELKTVWHPIGR